MAQDESYQTKTYHEREGDAFVFGSGGMGRIESGGGFRGPVVINGPDAHVGGGTKYVFSVTDLTFS